MNEYEIYMHIIMPLWLYIIYVTWGNSRGSGVAELKFQFPQAQLIT